MRLLIHFSTAIRVPGIGESYDSGKLGFHVQKILSVSPLPGGGNVAVVSGQAGPAMIAFDVCERMGLTVSPFSRSLQNTVNEILSPFFI